MDDPPPGYVILLSTDSRKQCREAALVLQSVGLHGKTIRRRGQWWVIVRQGDWDAAERHWLSYRRENPPAEQQATERVPLYGGAWHAVVAYLLILMAFATLSFRGFAGYDWFAAGQMQAGRVLQGEIWRVVTALTLHADGTHLVSNLAFGSIFGLLAGRILGGGLAWLTIVVAGALGNWMNALVQGDAHSSIGASTSVFAALGILVSHALIPRDAAQRSRFQRLSPLIGGVILLAMMGIEGERTDVSAHVTGFLSGMAIGWAGCRLPAHFLAGRRLQWTGAAAAVMLVVAAWAVALTTHG